MLPLVQPPQEVACFPGNIGGVAQLAFGEIFRLGTGPVGSQEALEFRRIVGKETGYAPPDLRIPTKAATNSNLIAATIPV